MRALKARMSSPPKVTLQSLVLVERYPVLSRV